MDNIENYIKDYQKKSIETIRKYLTDKSKKHCLIKLPTGTGKTGVMAIAANLTADNVLIIVPNATLPKQTRKEMKENFWKNIGYKPKQLKKIEILNGSKKSFIHDENGIILISTIQTLLCAYEKESDLFKELKGKINLILYDEGHREPAKMWSNVSRELSKKTILFTATPYRNDNYIFKIDQDFSYKYSMKKAIKNEDVKGLQIKAIPNKALQNNKLLAQFISRIIKDNDSQIIVRCEKSENIKEIVQDINTEEVYALGCHSDFNNENNLFNTGEKVLKILETEKKYKVVVHCDMLIEGINIPKLNILVLIDCFNNTKTIIQQIGRILRIDGNKDDAIVYVPEKNVEEVQEQWDMYIKAEEDEDNFTYVYGKFRRRLVFDDSEKFYEELNFPKQANVYVSSNSVFNQLKEAIENNIYQVENLLNIKTSLYELGKLWIICYEKREQSKILKRKFYFDKSLEFVSLKEIKIDDNYYYFYYDSSRYAIPNITGDIKNVDMDNLYRLVPENTDIKNVKYTSTSLSKFGAQTKTIEGINLNNIPCNLSEKLSFCRNVIGIFDNGENKFERYVSPITARISERSKCDYLEYIDWCEKIVKDIYKASPNNYFSRFAKIVNAPNSDPTSIMFEFNIEIRENSNELYIGSKFLKVTKNKFSFDIGNKTIDGEIVFDKTKKPKLSIHGLNYYGDYIVKGTNITFNKYIETNSFRLYFADEQIMFFNGNFLKPNIKFNYSNIDEFELWENIIEVKKMEQCENEKLGKNPNKAFNNNIKWPIDSVFGVIIDEIRVKYPNIDYLICDDLGYEIADFIALSSKENKVVFIHCKHNKSKLSASAFQDLCGQASKNIEYIMTSNFNELNFINEHIKRWEEEWSLPKNNVSYNSDRCIKGNVRDFTNEFKRILQTPNATKEVWLVNSGLSKKELKKELLKNIKLNKQQEQIPQLMWLLHTTQDGLTQAGAIMKIFCKE